jgi:hypothetical protein
MRMSIFMNLIFNIFVLFTLGKEQELTACRHEVIGIFRGKRNVRALTKAFIALVSYRAAAT